MSATLVQHCKNVMQMFCVLHGKVLREHICLDDDQVVYNEFVDEYESASVIF